MIAAGTWAMRLDSPRITGGHWVCPACGSGWIYEQASASDSLPTEEEIDFNDAGEPMNTASSHPILVCAECQSPVRVPAREDDNA